MEKANQKYRYRREKIIWQGKKVSWNYLAIGYGIRWSDRWQLFPVWNLSGNNHKELIFGIWKLFFAIRYARARFYREDRKRPFSGNRHVSRFYKLIF